ncbi:MAG: transcriptional regulator [Methanosarcinales archaeon]|jgi:predicted transcriptional regulator|nr:transcriptional regulator [Methanosarcinales archaeon]
MKHTKECETETIEMMKIYGFRPSEIKVLVYLSNGSEASSIEIEQKLCLRQPEVNLAVNKFVKLGYIGAKQESKKKGKGRPIKYYKLVVPFEEIVETAAERIEAYKSEILKNAELLTAAYRKD